MMMHRSVLIAALAAVPGFAPRDHAFDVAVSGLNVLATQNHTPVSSSLASGQPGQEYYLLCGYTPTGSGGPSSVQFRFLVNGQVVRDVQAPLNGQFVAMGEFWTPPSAGTYTLACDANPNKTFSETTYANNKQSKQFSVSALQIDPSVAAKVQIPARGGQVSAEVAKVLVAMPDIQVQGLEVHAVLENGSPTTTVVAKGDPGKTYYLYCVMEPVGPVASSSVRFLFRANGLIVRDVYAPVQPGTPVQMGAKWTPSAVGTYTLVCEANPQKTFTEATYENNSKQASFPVGAAIQPEPAIETAPGRLPGPVGGGGEKEPEDKGIILCPECFNPQPEPPGFTPDPPPDDAPFNPAPPPPGEMVPLSDKGEAPSVEAPDLVPELKLQGSGVLFPLQIRIRNQGTAPAMPSRARLTWHLACQKPDGTSAQTFPVGPREQVVSVPAIAADQFHDASLTGSKQYCEAPMAAVRGGLVCAEECQIRALADTDGMVHESDEINNAIATPVKRK